MLKSSEAHRVYDNKIIYAHNQEFTREKLLTNCLNMYDMHWYGTKLRKMQKKGKEIRKRIPLYAESVGTHLYCDAMAVATCNI